MMSNKVQLSEVVNIRLGQTFRSKAEALGKTGVKLIQIRDIQEGVITSTEQLVYADIESVKVTVHIQANDILLPLRGSRYEAALYRVENPEYVVTAPNQIAIMQVKSSDIKPEFLLWFFNSPSGHRALKAISTGSTISSIKRTALESLMIDLPSITIQEKIIAVYQTWVKQKTVLNDLLSNGEQLADSLCIGLLNKGNNDV